MNAISFDARHDAALLIAAGYVHEAIAADWFDDGDAENGPHLSGHPDLDVYTLVIDATHAHEVVVCDGAIVQAEFVPH